MNRSKSVGEAINFIEKHLAEKLDLDIVADSVHYSKYHLHRMFTNTVGLTIHDYVQRRRLTEAAKLLVFSDKTILDIALNAGYESQQAFNDIFKAMYKQPPNQFRRNEVFYPLQLKYEIGNDFNLLKKNNNNGKREIFLASEQDIPLWMELVRLVIDGFPNLEEEKHIQVLKRYIKGKEAFIMKEGSAAIGIMMISNQTGSIDFLGIHPLFRNQCLTRAFLEKAICEFFDKKQISITTFREGDKADTGYRKALKELGFAEAELLMEFGYPTQRMVLQKDEVTPSFPDEILHFTEIKRKLEDAIQKVDDSVERHDKAYMDTKRYMVENRGEIDPHEMFQNELLLKQIDHIGTVSVTARDRLINLSDSPYFARIDFDDGNETLVTYIGKYSFHYNNELLISDWRSPVAGMFYDYEAGPAGYDTPMGRISGYLERKRQFKIKNGEMEYALESATNIQDDVLSRELSHTSDEKMKAIITTIQKEQNLIIRNENAGTIIIQGVAGSGKTSIALHRIAYLLYRFKDRLSGQNIAIISPNKVFGDYISNVLPELGEEPIYGLSFADIAEVQLEGVIDFEGDKNPIETNDPGWAERVRYKSTMNFVRSIGDYLKRANETIFEAADYRQGEFFIDRDWIQNRFTACKELPVKQRIQTVGEKIYNRLKSDNYMDHPLPKLKTILKHLNAMLKRKNSLELYKDFYKQVGIEEKFVMPAKKTLEWTDVYPFLYFHAMFDGLKGTKMIRHLVIDEMQDYTPIQYAVINILFPCSKTILGDFGQFVNPNHLHTLENLRQLHSDAELVKLNKSYRSTYEIIHFAKYIQNNIELDVIERHGEEPTVICCRYEREQIEQIKNQINSFQSSSNVTLGIILKTHDKAKTLYDILSEDYEVHLLTPDSARFENGIIITSIQMSKGLEFDEVLIPSVNEKLYHTDFDRNLLYIACTRAMHRLTLTCVKEPASLIPDKYLP